MSKRGTKIDGGLTIGAMQSQYTGQGGDLPMMKKSKGRKPNAEPAGGGGGGIWKKTNEDMQAQARKRLAASGLAIGTQQWVQDKIADGDIEGGMASGQSGTSIFDPVLCELAYRWFCPRLVCAKCGAGLSSRHEQNLPSLHEKISGASVQAAEELLLPPMPKRIKKNAAASLPSLRSANSIPARQRGQPVLQQSVRGDRAKASENEAGADRQGVSDALSSARSDGDEGGLCHGASASDVASDRASDFTDRGGPSPERRQGRQSDRESRDSGKTRSRPNPKAAAQANSLPPLWKGHSGVGTCPNCKSDLSEPEAILPAVVLDPFAGGSVRGIVASRLGRGYVGIELRGEQVAANRAQLALAGDRQPEWRVGDSRHIAELAGDVQADLIFSCPPFWNLEVYSEDPNDISTLGSEDFFAAQEHIIKASVGLLKPDRFAVWVTSDVRDKDGLYVNLPGRTVQSFEAAGMRLYNEAILVTAVGSLPVRVRKQFAGARKLGRTHQIVQIYLKGNAKKATKACGEVEFGEVPTGAEPAQPTPDIEFGEPL